MKNINRPPNESVSLTVSRLLAVKNNLNTIQKIQKNGVLPFRGDIAIDFGGITGPTQKIHLTLDQKIHVDKKTHDVSYSKYEVEITVGDTKFTLPYKHMEALTSVVNDIVEDMQNSLREEADAFRESVNAALDALDE
jgi:hypothetical protein